jgi:hypothetical protein
MTKSPKPTRPEAWRPLTVAETNRLAMGRVKLTVHAANRLAMGKVKVTVDPEDARMWRVEGPRNAYAHAPMTRRAWLRFLANIAPLGDRDDLRLMPARFVGKCHHCGGAIQVGDPIKWSMYNRRAYHAAGPATADGVGAQDAPVGAPVDQGPAPAEKVLGLVCRECGCGEFLVPSTRRAINGRIRRRRERCDCHRRITTVEIEADDVANQRIRKGTTTVNAQLFLHLAK